MAQGVRNRAVSIALAATVLVHVGIACWLLALRQTVPDRETDALTVTWIERPVPVPPPSNPPPAPVRATSGIAAPPPAHAPRSSTLQAVEVASTSIDDTAQLPTATALLEQAADFAHDPLRRRPPPTSDGRFAMRRSLSPEDIAKGIGQLFGGAGYTQDPCPQIRRNIANLGTGGDAELTREELRRLQQYCL
jgi:type IV secretory pathway VirB10-like protein